MSPALFCSRVASAPLAALFLLAASPARAQDSPTLERFTVRVDGHPMALWARRPGVPKATILLIHGRTWSSIPDFDLQVPGEPRSAMQALAARGYAAYALDLRGYGATPRDGTGWLTPRRAASDVAEVLRWVAQQQKGPEAPVLMGWSNGALVSQLVAQRWPDRMSALVVLGYPLDPGDSIGTVDTPDKPQRLPNTAEAAASDFITPAVITRRVRDAYVTAALKADPINVDWRGVEEYNALDPARVRVPTLLIQGEFDPAAPTPAQARFFANLGTADRAWITIPGGDHAAILESTQPAVIAAVINFLERPKLPKGKR
jgi:pimeloyl-ACP methyl ester carboxylesterase